jgi:alkylation response protein AidB-like acyl-CoA dehydrogenase
MGFQFTTEQAELQRSARRFIEQECPITAVRRIREGGGHSAELHKKMADLGWLAIGIPEELGGAGGDALDLTVLHEELGRGLVPGAHTATMISGQLLLALGSGQQQAALLPGIASGSTVIVTVGSELATELPDRLPAASVTVDSDGTPVLSGAKYFVPHAAAADYFLVLAPVMPAAATPGRPRLFLVHARQPGLAHSRLDNLVGEAWSKVEFQGVKAEIVGSWDGGQDPVSILRRLTLVRCAERVGAAQRVVDSTLGHLRERVQYGRPLGSFQALQYRMLDLVIEVDHARLLTFYAAWLASQGLDHASDIAMAQLSAARAFTHVAEDGVHMHGGYALAIENDLTLYYTRSKDWVVSLGAPDGQLESVAMALYERASHAASSPGA